MSGLEVKKRMNILLCIFLVLLFCLVVALVWLNVAHGEEYKNAAGSQQTRDELVSSKRGTIYDRNMKALAVSINADTVIIDPVTIRKNKAAEKISQSLSKVLSMDYDKIFKITQKKSSYEVVKKRITPEQSQSIRELNLLGVTLQEDSKRNYVYGSLAANILGFTGYDNQGLNGIEMVLDDVLKGTSGRIRVAQANGGEDMPYPYESYIDPVNGKDVVLTIDEVIQHIAESRLNEAVEKYGVKQGGCVIVMDPNTGEVLGMAVTTGFDPNNPFEVYDGASQEKIAALPEDQRAAAKTEALNKQWRSKAISDTYEPGSVFKMFTCSSALEEGVTTVNSTFVCRGSLRVGGWDIKCWRYYNPHGVETLGEGLQNSCNVVFMTLGLAMGGTTFKKYVQAFGFENKTGFILPG
ncbi:MAG: penicillin-binding transpeptidase domain-containing protein, partial [Bacillota bacterium]|nr:penicillin-binding transpeptidase domain-containing protein [Bacillota bacterium]